MSPAAEAPTVPIPLGRTTLQDAWYKVKRRARSNVHEHSRWDQFTFYQN